MKNKALVILLIAIFIKGLVWLFFTPIFQIPDEPSHFSYVQFLAENNRSPHPRRDLVSSSELLAVSKIVNFNWKITHPVWQNYQKNWYQEIKALSPDLKKNFISNPEITSLKRPGLYYSSASLIYRLFIQEPFLWRFYSLRLFSLFCQILIIWLTYKICQKLFNQSNLSLVSAAMVGFHPGFSFILNSVSYEALGALIATLFIYLIITGRKLIWIIFTALIAVMIKPDLIFLWLLLPFYLPKKSRIIALILLILLFIGLILLNPIISQVVRGHYIWLDKFLYTVPLKDYADYVAQFIKVIFNGQIIQKTIVYSQVFIQVHYHQIFAWYWGVFGWLEKTLPPLVYAFLKLITLISLIGLFKAKKIKLLIVGVVIQALIVVFNDWLIYLTTGQIYGIQGRYFYSAIVPQMILFIFGLSRFISAKILIIGAVILNLIGLYSLFQYFGNVWW